jgi:hypothetical protein
VQSPAAALSTWTIAATFRKWPEGTVPNGFSSPVLALEFARSPKDVQDLLKPVAALDKVMLLKQSLYRDFGFMGAYMVFLAVLGWLLTKSRQRGTLVLGIMVIAGGVLAATADVLENCNALDLLQLPQAEQGPFLAALHRAVYSKWTLLFLVTGLLAFLPCARPALFILPYFSPRTSEWTRRLAAGGCAFVALFGLVGLLKPQWIETTSLLIAGAWSVIAVFLGFGIRVWFPARRETGAKPRA